jgi:serine/threonine protein kinase
MMGVVYLARDPDLGRDIALKVIQLPFGASETDRTSFERRFFSEAQSAARLSHPGIVIVHDVGRDTASGAVFMALELLPGRTLESLIKEQGRLDGPVALNIARRVAEALQHAHSEGVVHRDIKPANIMILPSGEPKIMDFGIAKVETAHQTATGQFVGTPLYMSPEQAMAHPVDGRSDLFSLGSVIYEMLTGTAAFAGESVTKVLYQLVHAEPLPPSRLVAALSPEVDHLLACCLAKNVDDRYPDAQALANDISNLLGDGGRSGASSRSTVSGTAETMATGSRLGVPQASRSAHALLPDWGTHETRALPSAPRTLTAPLPALTSVPPAATTLLWPPSRPTLAIAAAVLVTLGLAGWFIARWLTPPPVARVVTAVDEPPGPVATLERPVSPARPEPPKPPAARIPDAGRPAELVIDFEHSLKSGVLRVFIDEVLIVEEPFGGRVTRKVVGLEMRKGRLGRTLEVTPGSRSVRVQVSWDNNVKSERSQTVFKPGARMRLKAKLGSLGGLRKDLSLEWN